MDPFDWSVQNECDLLQAMSGFKPVGVNKHFQLFLIYDKFTEGGCLKDVNTQILWDHLESMYNLDTLDESEDLPFPNVESEFSLPDVEFSSLKESKQEEIIKQEADKKAVQKGRETPKKEVKKEEVKLPNRNSKDFQRRDSKDSSKSSTSSKKEGKKEPEKGKPAKNRVSTSVPKDEQKVSGKVKSEDTPRAVKRPTRGSLKPDGDSNGGKASPVTVQKRRRI